MYPVQFSLLSLVHPLNMLQVMILCVDYKWKQNERILYESFFNNWKLV